MKLLVTVSYYAPHMSGLTNSIKNLSELLSQHGYEVTVLTTQHKKNLPTHETINKVQIIRVPYLFSIHKGFFMPQLPFAAYHAIKETDAVIIGLPQAESVLIALLSRLLRKPVYSIYTCEVQLTQGMLVGFLKSLLRMSDVMTLSLSKRIITLTKDYANHASVLKKIKERITAIYPVILTPQHIASADKFAVQIPKKEYVIGYLGRMSSEKGLEYLLEAIPLLQERLGEQFVIVLAGPTNVVGEDVYRARLQRLCKIYGDHILLLGEVPDESLGNFYASVDLLVLPSINSTEAFGMVQVEAMLCGTPVVSTDLPGVRVPIRVTGMGEIVKQKSPEDLAEKIVKVLKHKNHYVKDKKTIREIFSFEAIFAQYDSLLSGKNENADEV